MKTRWVNAIHCAVNTTQICRIEHLAYRRIRDEICGFDSTWSMVALIPLDHGDASRISRESRLR
jgi:hypothetical protein